MKITDDYKHNIKVTKLTSMLLAALILTSCSSEPDNPADIIISGGEILTMAGEQAQYVEAIAVDDGKISFIGSKLEADKLAGKATQKIDLLGATVIPAVVSGVQQTLTLQGATNEPNCWKQATFASSAELIAALKLAQVEREKLGIGLFCLGYVASKDNPLTDADLDMAFPEMPVILVDASLQIVLTNEIAKKKFTLDTYKMLRKAIQKSGQQKIGLQVGLPADFMVIDKNPLKDKSASLTTTKITQTFVQGKLVLDAPKDLAMLAILDIFSAYSEEKLAQEKIVEMNAASLESANQEKLKKEAEAKTKIKAQVEPKVNAKPNTKTIEAAEAKEAAKRSNTKTDIVRKPAVVETPVVTDSTKPKEVRFNMTQDGKKMTPEDFDAWMKAQGIRIVPAKPATAVPPVEPVKDN